MVFGGLAEVDYKKVRQRIGHEIRRLEKSKRTGNVSMEDG